jgi:hypothetical protein
MRCSANPNRPPRVREGPGIARSERGPRPVSIPIVMRPLSTSTTRLADVPEREPAPAAAADQPRDAPPPLPLRWHRELHLNAVIHRRERRHGGQGLQTQPRAHPRESLRLHPASFGYRRSRQRTPYRDAWSAVADCDHASGKKEPVCDGRPDVTDFTDQHAQRHEPSSAQIVSFGSSPGRPVVALLPFCPWTEHHEARYEEQQSHEHDAPAPHG